MLMIDVSKKNQYLEELNRGFSQSEFDENNPDLDTIQRAIARLINWNSRRGLSLKDCQLQQSSLMLPYN